jgi:hypothetical protein
MSDLSPTPTNSHMKKTSKKTSAPAKKTVPASSKELAYGLDQVLAGQDEILKRLAKIESYLAGKGECCSTKKSKK